MHVKIRGFLGDFHFRGSFHFRGFSHLFGNAVAISLQRIFFFVFDRFTSGDPFSVNILLLQLDLHANTEG